MRLLIMLLVLGFAFTEAKAQINCDSIFNQYNRIHKGESSIMVFDSPPMLLSSKNLLLVKQCQSKPIGDVYVVFFIDSNGKPVCSKIARSNNELLNMDALKVVSNLTFKPASIRNAYVLATMTLKISFTQEQTPK